MAEQTSDITVDVHELSQIGWDAEAEKKVETAFKHLLEVLREEADKTPRTEAPKLTIDLKGTYTQKEGAGGSVGITITFGG